MVYLWGTDQVEVMKGFCGLYFLSSIFMASFEVSIDFDEAIKFLNTSVLNIRI